MVLEMSKGRRRRRRRRDKPLLCYCADRTDRRQGRRQSRLTFGGPVGRRARRPWQPPPQPPPPPPTIWRTCPADRWPWASLVGWSDRADSSSSKRRMTDVSRVFEKEMDFCFRPESLHRRSHFSTGSSEVMAPTSLIRLMIGAGAGRPIEGLKKKKLLLLRRQIHLAACGAAI